MAIRPMRWEGDRLVLLDQRTLPSSETWLELTTADQVVAAIRDMAVRGAPAIGVAAGYGVALAALRNEDVAAAIDRLAASRPTAVNLFWALDQMRSLIGSPSVEFIKRAEEIEEDDLHRNHRIGNHGATLIPKGARILTICNTGSLATAGHGTALGVIRSAYAADSTIFVTSCETRPRLQGLKLTAWELQKEGIPFRSIVDGAAASLMRKGEIDLVIAGADRIAANGDTANKIGTYSLAALSNFHNIPFYIAAPRSTLDVSIPNGDHIPIEEREDIEITMIESTPIAPANCSVLNPGFDVTPGDLITAIITEDGIHRGPYQFEDKTT